MSLNIGIPSGIDLRGDRGGCFTLPAITFAPIRGAVDVHRLETTAVLTAPGLDPSVRVAVENALRNMYRLPTEPFRLEANRNLPGPVVSLRDLLPANQSFDVKISVLARLAARKGDPADAEAAAQWRLRWDAESHPEAPLKLEVDPSPLHLEEGAKPVTLAVTINGPAPLAQPPPRLALVQRPDNCPKLQAALDALVNVPFTRGDGPAGGPAVWRRDVRLQLDEAGRRELTPLTLFEPLRLLCQVVAGQAARAELYLYIVPPQSEFGGQVAIDLGTSSSSVTIYDPSQFEEVKGFAPEQEARIRLRLLDLLIDRAGKCLVPGVHADAWYRQLAGLTSEDGGEAAAAHDAAAHDAVEKGKRQAARLAGLIRDGDSAQLMEALGELEDAFAKASEIRSSVRAALQQVYEEAFLEPRLESRRFFTVDLANARSRDRDIPSEVQLLKWDEQSRLLKVEMGAAARDARLAALRQVGEVGGGGAAPTLADIHFRYHVSPKRYLGKHQVIRGHLSGQPGQALDVTGQDVAKAAWNRLVELTNDWRRRPPNRVTDGFFKRVVVTYPTVATPDVRREIEKLVKDLGFRNVVMDFDEAVAAAFFYFHREMGGSLDLGPALFKSRAQFSNKEWFQNVLVLDIGGGSTDVALLRMTMSEANPFEGESRNPAGKGGRYYKVTPRLLGSSGNVHLGGDLITLRVFEILKASLADRLLVAVKRLPGRLTTVVRDKFDDGFKDREGLYSDGSLVAPVVNLPERDDRRRLALDAAESVLPTRGLERSRAFFALWELAEATKIKVMGGHDRKPLYLPADGVKALVSHFVADRDVLDRASFDLTVEPGDFERAAEQILQEAIDIALGLLREQLPVAAPPAGGPAGAKAAQESLDWLILSGKSWNLRISNDVLRRALQGCTQFAYNPDRITFDADYAKLATSIGACYAEAMRSLSPHEDKSRHQLEAGISLLEPVVKNLFWFLPSSFRLPTGEKELKIFATGQKLYQLDAEPAGKVRSSVYGAMDQITVVRKDYEEAKPIPWMSIEGDKLAVEIGMTRDTFRRKMVMQFEVDHRLLMRAFLWEGPEGRPPVHYAVDACLAQVKVDSPQPPPPGPPPPAVGFDVGVHTEQGAQAGRPPELIVRAGDPMNKRLHVGETVVDGLISDRIPDLFKDGKVAVYVRVKNTPEWRRFEFAPPADPSPQNFTPVFQLSVAADGHVRLHRGEVPYWMTTDPTVWQQDTTRVLSYSPQSASRDREQMRDPFNGLH